MPTYFSIPNHVTREIKETFSDLLDAATAANKNTVAHKDKADRRAWLAAKDTNAVIISLLEGLNTDLRVSIKEGNPVATIHGVIADYDAPAPGSFADQAKHIGAFYADTPALKPQWIQRTLSGHFRLIWEFAEPCSLRGCPDEFYREFIAEFRKRVRMSAVLASLDEAALLKVSTYYDARGDYERTNADPMAAVEVDGVFFDAVRKVSKAGNGNAGGLPEIPMEAVKQRLDELFPGRWPVDTPFVDGCRGPAVWDPIGLNPTTTIYTTTGAYRFSSAKGFHPYDELLGKDFVRQWRDNKLGQVTRNFWYIPHGSKNYFVKIMGTWEPQSLGDLQRRLTNNWCLSRKAPAHNVLSETEQAIQYLQDSRKVDAILPFIFDKREVVEFNNKRFLNSSRLKVMEPAAEQVDHGKNRRHKVRPAARNPYYWGEGFPWIAQWLGSWFDDPKRQLIFLLAWIKQAYESARAGTPAKGQALFLVGGVGRGKTLFNGPDFMGSILGGSSDAAKFLVGEEKFNKELIEVGYWSVDDAAAAIDKNTHQKFTENVKAFVANPTVTYHPKYVDSQRVPYNGRLCVTLNEDDESMRMIPDLDRNIIDKLIILRLSEKTQFSFPAWGEIGKALKTQLPYFLRWLTHWTPPASTTKGQTRFGLKAYTHRQVRGAALRSGLDSDVLEAIGMLWCSDDDFATKAARGESWEGTAADLYLALTSNPVTSPLIKGTTPRLLGRKLSALTNIEGSGVERRGGHKKMFKYSIKPAEFTEQ
jgi:hypothetical protein